MSASDPGVTGGPVALRATSLAKAYGPVVAVRDISIDLAPGQICAVIGPNGAGKTTLLSMLAGLVTPDQGSIEVCGADLVRHPQKARRFVGYAPQETGIYPTLTVAENVTYFGRLNGQRGAELASRVGWISDALGLSEIAGRKCGALSGGQKRRVHTAIALVGTAPVLLLDEPTVGSDIETRERLLALVRSLADAGSAVCYTTHYLPEVEALGASVVMIHQGQVIARGSVPELLAGTTGGRVEVQFDGPLPDLGAIALPASVVDDSTIAIDCDDPARSVTVALAALGDDAARVRGIEIVRSSLDAVFRQLTNVRLGDGQAAAAGTSAGTTPAPTDGPTVDLTDHAPHRPLIDAD
jgi:ABC-2 type transport system ATP-binding protein